MSERDRLTLLLRALSNAETARALPADDAVLVAVARHHRLTPLLSAERGNVLHPALAEAFRRDRVLTTARNLVMAQVAEQCIGAFAGAGVPSILLKGIDYEDRLYGAAGVRPTADVDLLVPNSARRAAFAVLDGLGFEPRAAAPGFDDADYHEVAWTRSGVEIDLHLGLAPFARCRIDYAAVWQEAEPFRVGQTQARVLARPHAAIFHALHMAIDHFAVPAIYLIDLVRLVPTDADWSQAAALAARWACGRPFETAVALADAFLPKRRFPEARRLPAISRRVIAGFGATPSLPRGEQLLRKLLHFDATTDAARYVCVQSLRNLRELVERRWRHRSARERLGFSPRVPPEVRPSNSST